MRKQFFFKSMLCLILGLVCNVAWAEVALPTVSSPELGEMHYYRIKNYRSNKYAAYKGDAASLAQTTEFTYNTVWYVTADGENYKLHNIATEKLYAGVSSFTDNGATVYIKENPHNAGYVCVSTTSDLSTNCWDDQGNQTSIGNYNPRSNDAAGTSWTFEEVTPNSVPFTFTLTETTIGKTYTGSYTCYERNGAKSLPACATIVGAEYSNVVWGENSVSADFAFSIPVETDIAIYPFKNDAIRYYVEGDNVKATKAIPTLGEEGNYRNYMWNICPVVSGDKFLFTLKNVGRNKFVYATKTNGANHAEGDVIVSSEDVTYFTMDSENRFVSDTPDGVRYLSIGSVAPPGYACLYHTTHDGTKNAFQGVHNVTGYRLTDSTGKIYEGSYNGMSGLVEPVLTGAYGHTFSNKVWNGETFEANINFPFLVSQEGGVVNKTMICSFASASYKWHADGLNLRTAKNVEPSLEKLNLYYWAIYPKFNNGSFGFVVKNVGTGKYIYSTSNRNTHDPGVVTFADEGSVMTIEANNRFKLPTGKYLSLNSSDKSDGTEQFVGTYGAHTGCNLAFTPYSNLNSYTITTGTTGYASGYTPIAVTIPNGVTVYTGKMITANKASIILNELTDATVIPANTAFVIKGVASTTYTFNKSNTAGTPVANNVIMGSADNVATSSISNGVVYTMQADGTFQKYTGETILGCNAYIKMPTGTTDPVSILDEADFVSETTDFKEGGVYTFVSSKGWVGATQSCANVISTAKVAHNVTGSAADPMFQWVVLKSTNGNYYLYNLGKQKFMGVESRNNTSVPFSDTPAGKKMSFKQSSSTEYPIMFSTDNAAVVNHNGSYGDGFISWTSGWNNLTDAGNAHQVTLVKTLTAAELQPIANIVEAYDKQLYVTTQVEGSWNDNPNTHFGNVTATSTSGTLSAKLKTDPSKVMLDYDGLHETTIGFTRAYRGFEFQGFKLGEQELGKSFTLTEEQKASITAETPLVAKFTCTDEVTLFYDDDEFSYRIPAIATTGDGRLIAVSDYRHCLDDIGLNRYGKGYRIDLVIRTSDDNGKTWSNIQTIAEGIDNSQANDCAYGDAAIAVVGEEVIVMAVAGSVSYGNGSAGSETEPKKTSRLVRIYSADNGVNWEKTDITEKVYGYEGALYPNMYTAFFGSGRLAVDPNFNNSGTARIYGSMLTQGQGNIVIYSDDKGLTWNKLGGQVANANEPKIEILPNGQILFSARRNGGRNFNVFTYTDKGTSTGRWSNAVNGCDNEGNNGTNGETFLVDAQNARGENVKLLLQSQPVGGGTWDRANVSIWYKEISSAVDYDHTPAEIASGWTKGLQVSHQLSAYSAMSLQKDGKIAFFFEEAPCYRDNKDYGYSMVYIPLTIEEITKNKYFSPAAVLPENITVNMVLTDAQGNEYHQTIENTTLANIGESVPSYVTLGENDSYVPNQDGSYTYTNTVTLPFKVSNENGTYWHNMYWPTAEGNQPIYLSASVEDDEFVTKHKTDYISYGASTYNTKENEEMIAWALFSVNNSFTFKFKNKQKNKYIQVTSVSPEESSTAKNVVFAEEVNASAFEIIKDDGSKRGDYSLKANVGGTDGYMGSTSATHGFPNHFHRSNHEGSWLIFKEAPNFDALITEANDVLSWIGEGLGKYTVSESNTAIAETAKTAMQTPNTVKLNDLNTYKNLLEGATLNRPESGQFFRIRGISGNYIDASSIYNNAQATTGQMSMKSAEECNYAGTIFYLDANKNLLNYATGRYVKETCEIGSVGDSRGVWTFAESPRKGKAKYALSCTTTNNNGRNLHDSDGNRANRCGSNCGDRHDFTLEPVTELPLTIHSSGMSTYSAPVDLEIPDGVTVYYAKRNDGETIRMAPLSDVIPANTGVVVQGEGTVSFPITTDATALENNLLKPVVEAKEVTPVTTDYSVFILGTREGVTGFYPLSTTNNVIGGHKSYLEIPATSAARLSIVWDDTETGIHEAEGGVQKSMI